ncbi:major facilitator superfamily domain-containing protein [Acrodontium crateriforme]|uniref:Major facilitator superfamily domain-containing protein n=1 Tax=Acrodontium crateriforme TaxID=150365 RepID=A0AAQ3M6P6_9PEZI|nr:major facilitator superfamily domain-containing protein [Acrodontium crateriforme]
MSNDMAVSSSESSINSPTDDQKQDQHLSTPHQFNEQTHYVTKSKIITIFLACATVDFVALMDQTMLAASLSIISNSLDAGSLRAWIAAGYFLTTTSFQLLYGRLSDIWSRKTVLLVGIAIFFFGSLASSLSQTAIQLIVFRAITGIGGGGLMTIAQAIVSDVVTLRERGKYQGILGAVVAIANGIGPVIGGALSSTGPEGWRWIFRMEMPISVLTALAVIFFMPLKEVTGSVRQKILAIDFPGIFLALGSSAMIVLALTWAGGEYAWSSPHVLSTLIVGLAVSIAFVLWQWKGTSKPMIPMHIFKSGLVNGACLTMFVNGWNFLVQVYYIPTFYQLVYGYSAVRSGALLLPITLIQTVSSTSSGLIVSWTGRYRESILIGWAMWAIGLGLFSTLDEKSGVGKQIGYAIITGFGVGQTLQPSLIAIQAGVARREMAIVTATRNFVRNLGGTLGLAISGTIINNIIRSSLSESGLSTSRIQELLDRPELAKDMPELRKQLVAAYQRGFRIVFVVCASLAAFAFVLAFRLMPQTKLDRDDDDALKAAGKGSDDEKKTGVDREAATSERRSTREDPLKA